MAESNFSLSYLKYNEDQYDDIFKEKIITYLNTLYSKPEFLECFQSSFQEKLQNLKELHWNELTLSQLKTNYGINVISSIKKYCRQRCRFAVRYLTEEQKQSMQLIGRESNANDPLFISILSQLFEDLAPHYQKLLGLSSTCTEIAKKEEDVVSSGGKYYYMMWEGGEPSVIVQVGILFQFLLCLTLTFTTMCFDNLGVPNRKRSYLSVDADHSGSC
jgi:hypothetical protein